MNKYETLKKALNLKAEPVGVKLIFEHNENDEIDPKFKAANKLERYCQFVKRASQGEFLRITKNDFLCVTGEIMLGFKEPTNLELGMRLDFRGLTHVLLFPISKYDKIDFDSILLIVNPRNCMDIIEAHVKAFDKPLKLTCGSIRGVCSEVTAHVIKREEINFSFLCSGSRIFAEFDDCEMLCGIPEKMTDDLIKEIVKIIQDRDADMELMRQSKNFY
ncbi:MAG: hypothetical protein EU532_11430 [Promethearchaeota archaeon]|nr:MAG: hypothetical protein EU532_11430 [Candidatus Lokiarchaeota archaeon]